MSLEQEIDAIQKKLDKVTKELEKVKKEAAREIGNFNDAEDHKAILKAIVGKGYANDESGRHLLREHAAAIVEKIQEKAKGDLLGQMQLAEADPDGTLRLAADESYLAASLKVPPPQKKIVRSEAASQHLIRDRQRGGRDAEAETKARSCVRFRLFFFEKLDLFSS